ncbi:MAG: response regulator [Lachnospiraceae bacterium]|nr:response regulator [Lachnospiraceae bacterium]
MKTGLHKKIVSFYTKEKELDILLFKVLGTAGFIVSLIGSIQSLFTLQDFTGFGINLLAAFASVGLLWFVHMTKKYVIGYLITSVSIFMILFAWLFMEMGGMEGSMPYFFMFGIVFTLMMYKGKLLIIMETLQSTFYMLVCFFSFRHPEYIQKFDSPGNQFSDQVAGILISSVGIGSIFMLYIHEYRKEQKAAEESSKAKSILLANISHEIRTPINMLLGMNEMILRESENTQINEYAQNVDNAGRQLLFMVNQFLDLSRIDMGKETLFEENFNIRELAVSLQAFFGKEAAKKDIELVLDMDKQMPSCFYGDIRKISQILSNLLSNAVKYTEEGVIVFTLQSIHEENGIYTLHMEVSDTGSGISEEEQEKIFESFERADIIRNRSIEGTGLGLAISNKLAVLMGSRLQVKSRYGAGSVFWMDLKLKKGQENESYAKESGSFIAPEAKVLAVDDNQMNLMVVKSLLKRTMVKVEFAQSAKESYEKYQKSDYDLVFMDYMMPEIDGIEAMKELKRIDKNRNRRVPIIVLTADASPDKRELFLEEGFDGYLLKPVESHLLEKMLMEHLPSGLITAVDEDEQIILPEEVKDSFVQLLKRYDISFELALKHLSGDVLQMARVAEYFLKGAEENMQRLQLLVRERDYDNAAILIHSIKGNSGNVGAEDLYYSARRLEKRAKNKDREYVDHFLDFFLMQYKRVQAGLTLFLQEFEKIRTQFCVVTEDTVHTADESDLWKELLGMVRQGNQSPALKCLKELEGILGESEELSQIQELIKSIEFDRAEERIQKILKKS